MKESRMIRLCRITDSEPNGISVNNLLEAIRSCNYMFSETEFKKRLKNNPFVDSLSNYKRTIDIVELGHEIDDFDHSETVKKIRLWRNNYFAHKGIKAGLEDFSILKKNQLSVEEIEIFLKNCHSLINKYLNIFIATSWTRSIVNDDDFKSLIKYAAVGLDKYNQDLENELKEYRNVKI